MGLSTTLVRGVPVPLANSAPTIVADLTGMRDAIVRRGNRMAEPSSVRAALTSAERWPGLEFFETDTGRSYRVTADGTGWVETTEPKANTTFGKRGTVPSLVPGLQVRAFSGAVATGASGTVELAYPGGAFPNAVMAVFGDIADADSTSFTGWKVTPRNGTVQQLGAARFIVTNAAGARVGSGISVPIDVIAIGY